MPKNDETPTVARPPKKRKRAFVAAAIILALWLLSLAGLAIYTAID